MLLLLACAPPPPEPPAEPPSAECAAAFAPAPGPLAAEAAGTRDPTELAEVRLREARLTGDPGFYTLAGQAVECGLASRPEDPTLLGLRAHVLVQFHRFAEAEAILAPLAARTDDRRHWLFLGDARVDLGDLDGAAAAWDRALALRPGLEVYDRLADLAWLRGDLDLAIELEGEAFSAASPADPEPMAWVASRLGWYRALRGGVPDEIGVALVVMPDHKPANLLLARWMIADGHPEAARPHLARAGETVEALRVLREIEPSTDVSVAARQDRRGWALVLAETDPAAALVLMDRELAQRHDAITRIGRAWTAWKAGQDTAADVRAALATGIAEPEVLVQAAEVTGDPEIIRRAERFAALLLPSWRTRLEAAKKVRRDVAPR